jgi:succinate dehydrogenase/fumarate reductase flavoprotein subunit
MRLLLASAAFLGAHRGWASADELNTTTTKVAVIGGGIAGAVTVLELLAIGHQDITLYEHSDSLKRSTSANIAVGILCCIYPC